MINTELATLIGEVIKGGIGIAFIILTPYAVKAFTATEKKAKALLGDTNYNYAKDYVIQQYKLHPEIFNPTNLVNLIDTLDNKFGDKLSRDTIKRIVDIVIVDFKAVK